MIKVSDVKVGACVMNRGEPAKIVQKERVTTGTHMHSKTKITLEGIFSGKSETLTLSHHENLEDVDISSKKGQVVAKVHPNQLQIMDLVSYETVASTVNDEIFQKVKEGSIITFIGFNGKIIVTESKG